MQSHYEKVFDLDAYRVSGSGISEWPVLICILGDFRLLKGGLPVPTHGIKAQVLLTCLALQPNHRLSHDTLLDILWPDCNPSLAKESLHTLVHQLKKLLGCVLNGAAPLVCKEGFYSLNTDGGVGVDLAYFEALVDEGNRQHRCGNSSRAVSCYEQAVALYRGEPNDILHGSSEAHWIMRREQIKNHYLDCLAYLSEYYYAQGDFDTCLSSSFRLLNSDPYREDVHRMVMHCYVRKGRRAQAIHHYQVCVQILNAELEAVPEASTTQLYNRIRLTPEHLD